MFKKKKALSILSTIQDPDLKRDLVSLDMIDNLQIYDEIKKISFKIIFTTPLCPLKEKIKSDCIAALKKVFLDWEVNIEEGFSVLKSKKQSEGSLSSVKNILGIISGKGGVGKSTVCAGIAYNISSAGAKVGILDGDIFGPSIVEIFGKENFTSEIKKNKEGNVSPAEVFGIKVISTALLTDPGQPIVWRGPMASKFLKQLALETAWGELDYLLIDLPPGTSDLHISAMQNCFLSGTIIVTTPHHLSIADVSRCIEMQKNNFPSIKILGIIENMAFIDLKNGEKVFPFGRDGASRLAEKYTLEIIDQVSIFYGEQNQFNLHKLYEESSKKITQWLSVINF